MIGRVSVAREIPLSGAVLALVVANLCLLPGTVVAGQADSLPGTVHALLINGGDQPSSNFASHVQHLQEMTQLLRQRGIPAERIHVFSADGEDPAADMATRDSPPQNFWLIDNTDLDRKSTRLNSSHSQISY